ncbi:hypothetical protein V8E55_002442 [Tylopilus felleus]
MAKPKPPFVVSSVTTKRYAPAVKPLVQKLPPIQASIPTKERLPIPRGVPKKQGSRPGSLPTVVTKVEPRQPLPQPMPMPAPKVTTKVQMLLPQRTLPRQPFLRQPVKLTIADELPPRPSCVPRTRTYRSSAGVSEASMGTQGVRVRVSTTGLRNLGIAREKPSFNIGMSKTAGRPRATDTSVKKPIMAGDCRTETLTRNRRLTPAEPVLYPQAVKPSCPVALSTPVSPDLSSFPSQSWTIVVDVDIKQAKTPTTICGDETFSGTNSALKSDVAGMHNDSCGPSGSIASSPTLSLSPTVFQTPESSAEATLGLDDKKSSPTTEPSTEVSRTTGAATIISPSRKGTPSSVAALVRVLERNQASSPTGVSSEVNRRSGVQSAIELARTFFSPLQRASQLAAEAASHRTLGTNVSRIRNLFIPPLEREAKASKNPSTQMEIEMLRAQKKVANGGVVDPRLDRLGSLAAMAIVTKRLMASDPDGTNHA